MNDRARKLQTLASELQRLADQACEPSRSLVRAERLIAEGERIATDLRGVLRGSAR